MTASNGIRTENKMMRLAAAIGVALAAMLAAASLSPARADAAGTSDGNLVIDVPTTVPCALMADGTVVSPSEWNITTSGDAYIASASASGFPANVEWSARTTDLAAAQTESVEVAGTGDAASVTGPSDPASAKLAPSAGFEWAFSKLDAGKNSDIIAKAAGGTAVLGSVTFTFAKTEPDAFAVYSAGDGSLTFYKRADVPIAGQMFEGKTATEVYTGIETMTSIPGWVLNYRSSIETVTVVDDDISPISTEGWFNIMRNLKTADVSKLDMSKCKTISCMFGSCTSLETLDLSAWDTRSLKNMNQAFQDCSSLTKLNVSGWDVSKVTNMRLVFAEDKALSSLDLSTWDNSAVTTMEDAFSQMNSLSEISLGSKFKFVGTRPFLPEQTGHVTGADGKWYDTAGNGYAPADIPSNKAMTYTAVAPKKAFAVYSADDNSLSFYKRSSVPAAGDAFEGKTATEVYEGVEDASYTAADGAPWGGHAAELASVTVADAGVSPVSTAYWFKGASKLKSVNLAALDTSQTTCMDGMFQGCSSLESLDLSAMSTRRVASMTAFLGGCDSLAELSLGSEFAWVDDDCYPPTGDWKQGSTGTDYSESDIPANKTDKYTRIKTAFAVYSADDNSLSFYKRVNVPSVGDKFESKTVTAIYTGIETDGFTPKWTAEHGSDLESVTVTDEGIAPKSTASWFKECRNLVSSEVAKLDMSKCKDISYMFSGCDRLMSLDLSSWDTSSLENISYMLESCRSLREVNVFGWDISNVTDMERAFYHCNNVKTLDISTWDNSKTVNMNRTFWYMYKLEKVKFGDRFRWVGDDPYLPDPSDDFIPTADGMWYAESDSAAYIPSQVPEYKADTYFSTGPATVHDAAFAVYSADDNSLAFYKRASVPAVGEVFEGKTATGVYSGIESGTTSSTMPWSAYQSNIKTVAVIDDGIAPATTACWFKDMTALESVNLSKLTTRNLIDMSSMFNGCSALTSLDLSSFDTRNVRDMLYVFADCKALKTLDLSSFDTGKVRNMRDIFYYCRDLQKVAFGAGWKWVGTNGYLPTPSSAYIAGADGKWYDAEGNGYAPKDIPSSKAMTYTAVPTARPKTAFAVYSATDGSLSFYNRAEVPKQGSMFLGKRATAVYTGFETKTSIPGWMLNYSSSIKTVTVYDEGIAPIGTGHWFAELRNMKTADVSKLDMSRCKTISCMFTDCTSLETLDLSAWDTRSLTSMSQAFQNCTSLTKLDVSGWDVSKVTDMDLAFAEDRALSSLDLSTWNNSAATTMKDVFSMMDSLNEVSLGSKFKFTGTRPFLPEQTGHVTGFDGKWYAKSTGIGYAPADVPSYKAETYYATKALRNAAVGVASNLVDDDSTAVPAATSTCKAQGESTTQKDAMGKQQLVEIASKGSDAASEPEGAEKAAVKKSGE